MLIAAIDSSFDDKSKTLIIGILIGSYSFIHFLHKSISSRIRRSCLHFREMSKEEKNVVLNVIRQYASQIRLIVILVENKKLTLSKRKKIAKFIEGVLRGANISHVYVCTDLDRTNKGTFILSESLNLNVPISRGDLYVPIQVADVVINYYRRKNEGLNVSVKKHNC